jgi:hypothetical protein
MEGVKANFGLQDQNKAFPSGRHIQVVPQKIEEKAGDGYPKKGTFNRNDWHCNKTGMWD